MLLRYPGGKTKVAKQIVRVIEECLDAHDEITEFREPFFGGGAVGLRLIRECQQISRAWLNDADPAMACLWRSVVEHPRSMRVILGCLEPSVAYFDFYKELLLGISRPEDLDHHDPAAVASMKIAVHRMSYSGLGTMAGGPIGGKSRAGTDDVGCRYNPERIAKSIATARDLLGRVELRPEVCTCLDFEDVVRAPGAAIFYLDPPYYRRGPELYQFAFGHDDHIRLAGLLRAESRPWLISYDRHPVIEELYGGWASITEFPITYTIHGTVRTAELLIRNF